VECVADRDTMPHSDLAEQFHQQLWRRGFMSDNTDPVVRTGRREALKN
jgi:hypothetical protein